jgi:hypothetical protein
MAIELKANAGDAGRLLKHIWSFYIGACPHKWRTALLSLLLWRSDRYFAGEIVCCSHHLKLK